MPKVCADLSDIEYEILKNLKMVEGVDGEKLRNLLRHYIYTIPDLKSSEYALKRIENKKEIEKTCGTYGMHMKSQIILQRTGVKKE